MMSDTTERPNEPDRKALAAIPGRWAQPEPATLAIWGTLSGLGLIAARRRKQTA